MTGDDSPFEDAPTDKLGRLRYSISTLWDDFGRADHMIVGLAVNVALSLVGVAVFVLTSGVLSYAGAVWAIINILPVVQWVLRL